MSDASMLKFLCFNLGDRVFAVDIMGIREIMRMHRVTPVPEAPEMVAGVLNVRGELMTVLDTRKALGVTGPEPDERDRRTIIAMVGGQRFGLLVDSVEEVAALTLGEIEPPPAMEGGGSTGAVLGIFKRTAEGERQVVVLLRLGALARLAQGKQQLDEL